MDGGRGVNILFWAEEGNPAYKGRIWSYLLGYSIGAGVGRTACESGGRSFEALLSNSTHVSISSEPIHQYFTHYSNRGGGLTRHKYQHVPLDDWDGTMNSHHLVRGRFDKIINWINHMPSGDIVHSSFDQ